MEELTAKVVDQKLMECYEKRRRIFAHHTNWASLVGHPCIRYLTLLRSCWEEIPGASAELQARFDSGKALHRISEDHFREAGFKIYVSPDPLNDKELQVSGYMDFEISLEDNKKTFPVEIKSVEDWDIDRYRSIEDMLNGKWWVRGYLAQLALYCWMRNKEKGFFHLRSLKRWRDIELSILDEKVIGFVQELMEKLKSINKHFADGTLPDRLEWDEFICGKCNAKHICLPEEKISNGEVLIDESLEAILERREELTSAKREFEELDKEVKRKVKEKPRLLVGNFVIEGKWQERKESIIPASKFWVVKIKKIGGEQNEGNLARQTGSGNSKRVEGCRYEGGKLPDNF